MRTPTPQVVNYSYTLLHNRLLDLVRHLADGADAIEKKSQSGDLGVWAFGAITVADNAIEIAINQAIELSFPPHSLMPEHWPVHQFAFERLGKTRPSIERLKALTVMQHRSPNWNEEPWISVRDLHIIRNALMHYESRPIASTDPNVDTFPNQQKLQPIAQRLGSLGNQTPGSTWLELFLNPIVARWAYDTAVSAIRLLESQEWRKKVPLSPSDLA